MYKVLIFGMNENPGGVESFLMGYFRNIDHNKIHFDFLCNSNSQIAYESEICSSGAAVYHISPRSGGYRKYKRELKEFFENHAKEYDCIWVNVCSLANIDYLIMAKKYGIKRRIIHSHNSQNMDSRLRGILHKMNRNIIARYATDFWACGEDAARWFYNDRNLKKYVLVNNAIDTDSYQFNEISRKKIRNEIGCQKRYVIGNVGRLHFQKNQLFLLDIFKEVKSLKPDSELVLIGQGEDEAVIKKKIKEYHLENDVLMAGVQKNIAEWLCAFDFFLFPSKFEGLAIAPLEAQANGVPCLLSADVIPAAIKVNENVDFFSLGLSAKDWAKKVLLMRDNCGRMDHEGMKENFRRHRYDIKEEAKWLTQKFLEDVENKSDETNLI